MLEEPCFNLLEWGFLKKPSLNILLILLKLLVLIKETYYLCFQIYFYSAQPDTSHKIKKNEQRRKIEGP